MLSYLEVPVGLEQRQEADLGLPMNALDDEVVAHVLVAIEDVAGGLAHQDNVNEFLGSVAVLGEQGVLLDRITEYTSSTAPCPSGCRK